MLHFIKFIVYVDFWLQLLVVSVDYLLVTVGLNPFFYRIITRKSAKIMLFHYENIYCFII